MQDFTSGSILKKLLVFTLPMLIGALFQQMYGIVDAVVVGRFLGGGALAAVGISMTAFWFIISMLFGLTTGASVIISQLFGAKDNRELEKAVSTSVVLFFIISVTLTIIGVVFTPTLLRLLNAPAEIFDDAALYMRVQMGGLVFPMFFNMYTAYLRAIGNSRTPLYFLIFSTTFNGVLNVVLVVGLGFGLGAVAAGTVVSQGIAAVLCYYYVKKHARIIHVKKLEFDTSLFGKILKYGTPAAFQLSLVTLAMLTITRLINTFGTEAMAGITAAGRIDQMAILPVSTLSMALSTFVAQNIGAGLEERAIKGLKTILLSMVLMAVGISAIVILVGPWLISMFIDLNEAGAELIMQTGLDYLNIMVLFYFLFAILFAFNGFYRGVGDAFIAMVFPVLSLTLRTLSAYGLVHFGGMGPEALGWSIPVGWSVTSLLSFVYFKKRLWVGKAVTKKSGT